MTQTTRPDKYAVRELLARPHTVPLDMEQIKRELCWHLIEAEREAEARREATQPR